MISDPALRELTSLARRDSRDIAFTDSFSFLSAFVARRTEKIHSVSLPVAGLLMVLEGLKTIVWAGRTFTYGPGMAFILPEGAYVDVVNEPDSRTGVYRAVFLGFAAPLLDEARRRWSNLAAGTRTRDPTVRLTPALYSAILHATEALSVPDQISPRLLEHRLLEVLLNLAECGATPMRPDLRTCSMTDAVRAVVREAPARAWTVAEVAARLNTSDPTLRRNLRQEGAGFRTILVEERMRAARLMLMEGQVSIAEAAVSGGYASLSHFTKRFRAMYGQTPSDLRPRKAAPRG